MIKNFFIGVKEGTKLFGETISGIVNFILLSFVYFIGVGVTSIIAKLSKKRFLELKISEKEKTYWSELNLTKKPLEEYYRQF